MTLIKRGQASRPPTSLSSRVSRLWGPPPPARLEERLGPSEWPHNLGRKPVARRSPAATRKEVQGGRGKEAQQVHHKKVGCTGGSGGKCTHCTPETFLTDGRRGRRVRGNGVVGKLRFRFGLSDRDGVSRSGDLAPSDLPANVFPRLVPFTNGMFDRRPHSQLASHSPPPLLVRVAYRLQPLEPFDLISSVELNVDRFSWTVEETRRDEKGRANCAI